jgi:hypothetical protein
MPGRKPQLNELELRKQLLIAESELQRTLIREDWRAMEAALRSVAATGKSALSMLSTTAIAAAGVSTLAGSFRRGTGSSWVSKLFSAGKFAASLWFATRQRSQSNSEQSEEP